MKKRDYVTERSLGHRAVGGQGALAAHVWGIWLLHSPVAESPWAEILTFVHLCGVPLVLRGSLRGSFAVSNLARLDHAKPWVEGLRTYNESATKRAFSLFSIFWNSDYRKRFPLKSTAIWRYRKHRFCVLKYPLKNLYSTHETPQNLASWFEPQGPWGTRRLNSADVAFVFQVGWPQLGLILPLRFPSWSS